MWYNTNRKHNQPYSTLRVIVLISSVALIFASGCRAKLFLSNSEKTLYAVTSDQPKDSSILAYYLPYKAHLDSQMNKVIAVSAIEIVKGKPEGPLNNLMADAMFSTGKLKNILFDVAYTNYGGLRIPLPKGNIPLYKVFELMPFENLFTTVKFSGADMQAFFDYVAAGGGDPISGATFKIKDKKAIDVKINGRPLEINRDYTLLTSDYMANGGDGGEIFYKSTDRKTYDIKLRDALLIYLEEQTKAGKILNPVNDGRITVE
jgi:2',3'-cyclic-nucleotide 2'-phosphodiesterase (5'-nucleotidase family)